MASGHQQVAGNVNSFNVLYQLTTTISLTSIQKSAPRGVKFCSGYRRSNHSRGTKVFEPIDSMV